MMATVWNVTAMTTLDKILPGLAERLIDKFGAGASLEIVTKTDDLASGKVSESVVATPVNITPTEPFAIGQIDGTLVQAGDLITLAAAQGLSTAPVANRDRLVFASETWQVVAVDPVYSGDSVAAYRLHLRR